MNRSLVSRRQYTGTITVNADLLKSLEKACKEPPGDCGRGETIFDEEYRFPNGYRMAVQVIASEEPESESCWTQGVLFDHNGNEVGCTDAGDSFAGEYFVFVDNDEYVVTIL